MLMSVYSVARGNKRGYYLYAEDGGRFKAALIRRDNCPTEFTVDKMQIVLNRLDFVGLNFDEKIQMAIYSLNKLHG